MEILADFQIWLSVPLITNKDITLTSDKNLQSILCQNQTEAIT